MKYIRQFRNDDHFPKTYAIYKCDVVGCDEEETVVINHPERLDKNELRLCPKCRQMSGASKKQRLIDRKQILMDELQKIEVDLQIMEMTESNVTSTEVSAVDK